MASPVLAGGFEGGVSLAVGLASPVLARCSQAILSPTADLASPTIAGGFETSFSRTAGLVSPV